MFGDKFGKIQLGRTGAFTFGIGKHNNLPDSAFDQRELAMGIKEEMEHTDDPTIAKNIARDHLKEDRHYYTKLKKAGL